MNELSIASLKSEYQQIVLENQKKYNSNFDAKLDKTEIGILMQDVGVKSENELLQQGWTIERTSKPNSVIPKTRVEQAQKKVKEIENQERIEKINKEIKSLKKQIASDTERLQELQSDYKNGTSKGASCWTMTKTQEKIIKTGGLVGAIAGAVAGLATAPVTGPIAPGIAIVGFMFGAGIGCGITKGACALYNKFAKYNPDNEISIRYQASLPQLIKEFQTKLNNEKSQLNKLLSKLK